MRIYLDQIGCRLNYSEMETLANRLAAAGHVTVDSAQLAQVIIFNTCTVTADAARSSRKQLRHFHSVNPHARIVVTGCWAALARAEAASLPGVAMVADNEQKDLLPLLLEPWSAEYEDAGLLAQIQPNGTPLKFAETAPIRRSRTRAFLKVQDGCNNRCTFCIVTVARGASRSRTLHELVGEVQTLAGEGVQEVVLTGVHLGSFGRDLEGTTRSDLKELVSAILTDTDIPRLRLSSLEPWELADGFFDLWERWPARLCPHLHLPLQAGTDKQLRAMARRCTTASFRQLVATARSAIPDLLVTTDLIVGFPGENDADFGQGMAFVEEMQFAHAHIFPFSARAGTAAASFAGQVAGDVKKARSRRMHALLEQTGRAQRQRFVGSVRQVLWEGEGQPLTDQPGLLWSGHTDNYLRVLAVAPAQCDLHNQILSTRLDAVHDDQIFGSIAEA